MNSGSIITRALNRAHLSVSDVGFRDLATEMLDEIIQEHWTSKSWKFRIRPFTLTTADGTTEYALNKLIMSPLDIVPNSIIGTSPYRRIKYIPSHEFHRTHAFEPQDGDPYRLRESQLKGFLADPSAASVITFVSSLSNYTTGTVTVVNGSRQIIFSGATITIDMMGRYIRFGTDTKAYRLISKEGNSSTVFYLSEAYEGTSGSGVTFALGDISQKVTVLGYSSGQLVEEELELNGATSVATSRSFTALVKITKSDKTHGYVTGTSNTGGVTNIVLDPGETECEIAFVNLYPIPTKTETINYEAYIKHPYLYKYSDSPLFPAPFHNLLQLDLYIKLMNEWHKQEVSDQIITRREKILSEMISRDNSTDGWTIYQESDESVSRTNLNNLPASYGSDDGF